MRAGRMLSSALAALALGACATASGEGRQALREGRYSDAAARFEDALARDPNKTEALVGLGVAKYKAGAYDEAIPPLERAVAREPRFTTARLYLGLTHLRRAEYGPVEGHFKTLIAERAGTRLAAQADRVLRLLRGADPATDDVRAFMAASLENELESERDVAEARRIAREAEFRWRDAYYTSPLILRSRCRC